MENKQAYIVVYGKCKNHVEKGTIAGFAMYNGNKDLLELCAEGSSNFVYGVFLNKKAAQGAINTKRNIDKNVTYKIKKCTILIGDK